MNRQEYRAAAKAEYLIRKQSKSLGLLERLLWSLTLWAPFGGFYISTPNEGGYLLRTFLLPLRKGNTKRWSFYLHFFIRGDSDRNPHNHPWSWARSMILLGGYKEQVVKGYFPDYYKYRLRYPLNYSLRLQNNSLKPLSFNKLTSKTFHRVDLIDKDRGCWTLFVGGPRLKPSDGTDWGFLNLESGVFTPWGEYESTKNQGPS